MREQRGAFLLSHIARMIACAICGSGSGSGARNGRTAHSKPHAHARTGSVTVLGLDRLLIECNRRVPTLLTIVKLHLARLRQQAGSRD